MQKHQDGTSWCFSPRNVLSLLRIPQVKLQRACDGCNLPAAGLDVHISGVTGICKGAPHRKASLSLTFKDSPLCSTVLQWHRESVMSLSLFFSLRRLVDQWKDECCPARNHWFGKLNFFSSSWRGKPTRLCKQWSQVAVKGIFCSSSVLNNLVLC